MKQAERRRAHPRRLTARIAAALAATLCLGLLLASQAAANFEQVTTFAGTPGVLKNEQKVKNGEEEWAEEVQLGGLGGLAVNRTGAGGVPAGTVYAATSNEGGEAGAVRGPRVAMFEPEAGGGLKFVEGWGVTDEEGEPPHGQPYEPCGPVAQKLPDGSDPGEHAACPTRPEAAGGYVDIGVDQATGNVYVFRKAEGPAGGFNEIVEYSADGASEVTRFAQQAPNGKDAAETPQELHTPFPSEPLAVGTAGTVYVADEVGIPGKEYHRVMVFKPHNGDYADYEYAGEVAAGAGTRLALQPEVDDAGNLYALKGETAIVKYAPEAPGAYPAASAGPTCSFEFTKGGLQSITVDPSTGEVFFASYKEPDTIHRLSPCAGGKFSEAGTFKFSPKRGGGGASGLQAMAFDPLREAPGRAAGFLYAGSNSPAGGKKEGSSPEALTESALGYAFALPVELSPTIKDQSFAHVTTTTAVLGATINPKGSATHYAFQYETEAAYEANEPSDRFAGALEAPPGGASAGEGSEGIARNAALSGLAPDTAYRFRTVATSHCSEAEPEKLCETDGEALALRTFPAEAPGLPDQRAYELVSPAEKHGGQVVPADTGLASCGPESSCDKPGLLYTRFPMQSDASGDAVSFEGTAFDSEGSALIENEYLARRDPKAGWQSTNLTPTQVVTGARGGHRAFSADLGQAVILQLGGPALAPGAPEGYQDLYVQSSADPFALTPLLSSEPPNRPASGFGTFEVIFAGASADLSRIFFEANDALTEETPFAPEAIDGGPTKFNLYEWHEGQLALVNVMPGNAETQPGARFGDARHFNPPEAFTTNAVSEDGTRAFFSDSSGQVYLREDGEVTREIETEGTPDPGEFIIASPEGSKVLLRSGHLHYLDGEEATIDLTEGKGGFQGVVGESEDLSHLYFADTAVLTGEEENERHETAKAGESNLYAWAQGEGTRFVAIVSGDNSTIPNGGGEPPSDWHAPYQRTAEASPDGRYLAFLSYAHLTGYDSTGPCDTDHLNHWVSGPCTEAFLYDSATGKLSCASCNASGESPLGEAALRLIQTSSNTPLLPQPRYLSNEGRLFFDSRDSLVPADTNDGVEDVYEFEPEGVGTCEREAGCVSLISAGTGVTDSNFLAANPSGANVFFTTRDQLALKDKDELIDLYDARVEGGIPSETEVARGECQGEACQPQVTAPNDPTPGSSTFEGAGNVDEKKAAKKHQKKKHAKKHKAKKHAHKRAAKHNRGGSK